MGISQITSKIPRIKFVTGSQKKAGLPPGTLIHVGEKLTDKSELDLISYNPDEFYEISSGSPDKIFSAMNHQHVSWINIDGLHNIALIEKLGEKFQLDPLLLEDVLNTDQRPKSEDYRNNLFFTLKTLHSLSANTVTYEQISFVLGKDYLISFQEKEGDLFDALRSRLRNQQTTLSVIRARKKGPDYLFYRLIDTIVDSYYVILENLGGRIEELEDMVYDNPTPKVLQEIQELKRELIILRKTVYPLREAVSLIVKGEHPFIKAETVRFFTDVYDHAIHVIETVETYRDLTSSLMDMYMTSMSNKMNEVMKVLTIIATIFIPLTFIAGIYGMNFRYMPELEWKYGYPAVWGLMLTLFGGMMYYFKRKKWL